MAELSRLLGTTGHPSSEAGDDAVAQGGLAADMVKHLLDERIIIETATSDGIEILITAGLVAIGAKTGHAGQGELLAGETTAFFHCFTISAASLRVILERSIFQ